MSGRAAAAVALIVMAKAPRPGLAKTRLIPALGAEGAARLAQRMLQHTLAQARAAALGPVWLLGTPTAEPADFGLPADHGLHLASQAEGDLGRRMQQAFQTVLKATACQAALMVGTDAPALEAATLRQAAAALQTHDAVFVPASDGGYALIGLRAAASLPAVFDHMPWSTPELMQCTRERLQAGGHRFAELPVVTDIDEPADLAHLPAGWL
jgi:rSAM/selenodomain-associated transferase 1